jgi:hypothetical protein
MSTNHCFTLGYNLTTEVEKVTKLLYELNDRKDFKHLIVDLGFPLVVGNEIPEDIEKAKEYNSEVLKQMAADHGSDYVKLDNIGVSQNWTQVFRYLQPADDDVLIGCDPDEWPLDNGWVKSMGDVVREGNFALISLMMTAHINILKNRAYGERWIADRRVYILPNGSLNWALIGLSGKFLNLIKEVPYPPNATRYGWIEGSLIPKFSETGMTWGVLADYKVRHTDFELGDAGTSSLLREWKNQIIFNIHQYGQLSFDEWLQMRKEERI